LPKIQKRIIFTKKISMKEKDTLSVFKASAGSGKTWTLTQQYIKLLLNASYKDEEQFRHILAVTFTNKATAEMKSRIVERLYEISIQEKPTLIDNIEITPERAKKILCAILHNYSFFKITTIDKFFQQIIRSFVSELGLNSNYSVELDDKRLIKDTIADIMLKLGDENYEFFMKWFYNNLLLEGGNEENSSDDIIQLSSLRTKLEKLSEYILKEKYSSIKDLLPDATIIAREQKRLKEIVSKFETSLISKAEDILQKIEYSPFEETDCKNGAFTPLHKIIERVFSPEDIIYRNTFTGWQNKAQVTQNSAMKATIETEYNSWLKADICDIIDEYNKNFEEYTNAKVILKNLQYITLFKRIEEEILSHSLSENTQPICKAGEFIKQIIDGSDTPFIYEKSGTFIEHFFIDEFQDTSRLQWDNFKPLIADSLAKGMSNLIVGDVKQSIYRFRDSDWSILGKDVKDCFPKYYSDNTLNENHRSLENIIKFNNKLFKTISRNLQKTYNSQSHRDADRTIELAYSDVIQNIPSSTKSEKGYVEINFVNKKREDYEKYVYYDILDKIVQLIENGYSYSDIGILVRKRSEAQSIAEFLLKNGINVISEEALKIASNSAISDIVTILNYIISRGKGENEYIFSNIINANNIIDIDHLSTLPLYEVVEQVIFTLELDKQSANLPYLNAFKDLITSFISKKGANIKDFLEHWKEIKDTESLTTTSTADAVNIITIHKSKGLAYSALIMPKLNWEVISGYNKDILWLKIPQNKKEYSSLNCIPIEFESRLKYSMFKENYYDEVLMQYIDNLNFLYVAFTRARDVIIGYCNKASNSTDEDKEISSMNRILALGFDKENNEDEDKFIYTESNADVDQYICGNIPKHTKGSDSQAEESNNSNSITKLQNELSPEDKLKQFPLRSEDYKIANTEYGNRMHSIMEHIRVASDIEPVVEELLFKGYITKEQQMPIISDLKRYVLNPAVESWFDGKSRVISERSIVSVTDRGNKIVRPDRVLINPNTKAVTILDYKFGENKSPKHIKQVEEYVSLYKKAGYKDVTGYLYYFDKLEIVKV